MEEGYYFKLLDQNLLLLPEKALIWLDRNILLISDIHLGKAGHFRRSGIAIPSHIHQEDLDKLQRLIEKYNVVKLMFLGDLFHSLYNEEWEVFKNWLQKYKSLEVILIQGNHDILPLNFYTNSEIKVHTQHLIDPPFIFSHIPLDSTFLPDNLYNISGHIHPGIKLYGKGRQSLSLPCFYFGDKQAIMPAFGIFTGKFSIQATESCKIFAIADNKIISI